MEVYSKVKEDHKVPPTTAAQLPRVADVISRWT